MTCSSKKNLLFQNISLSYQEITCQLKEGHEKLANEKQLERGFCCDDPIRNQPEHRNQLDNEPSYCKYIKIIYVNSG